MEIRLLVEDAGPKDGKSALVFLSRHRVGNIPAKLQFRVDEEDMWKDVDIVFQSQLDKAIVNIN